MADVTISDVPLFVIAIIDERRFNLLITEYFREGLTYKKGFDILSKPFYFKVKPK